MYHTSSTGIGRAWLILFILCALLALSSTGILVAGVDQNEFQTSTGLEWSAFQAREPGAAEYVLRLLRLLGTITFAFTLLGAVISFTAFRSGQRWAWYALWLIPLAFAACAAIFFTHDAPGLGIFYAIVTALALLGLVLPARRFFPKR
jgi:hypothetical protein